MKVYLSTDMEGTAGIVDWAQCIGPGPEYEMGRRLLLAEVNAAIDGALAAGATEVVVNDSHSTMANLPPAALHGEASYISGRFKPLYMMEGLDPSYAAVLFVSYHGGMSTAGVLSHTYNPAAVTEVRINGVVAGESGLNALVAAHHAVPVVLVTGDDTVGPEAAPFCPGIEVVEVKRSLGRFAAVSLHPDAACRRIRDGAERAVRRAAAIGGPRVEVPARLEVDLRTAELAALAGTVDGVTADGGRTVAAVDDDRLRLFRTFLSVLALTRLPAQER